MSEIKWDNTILQKLVPVDQEKVKIINNVYNESLKRIAKYLAHPTMIVHSIDVYDNTKDGVLSIETDDGANRCIDVIFKGKRILRYNVKGPLIEVYYKPGNTTLRYWVRDDKITKYEIAGPGWSWCTSDEGPYWHDRTALYKVDTKGKVRYGDYEDFLELINERLNLKIVPLEWCENDLVRDAIAISLTNGVYKWEQLKVVLESPTLLTGGLSDIRTTNIKALLSKWLLDYESESES